MFRLRTRHQRVVGTADAQGKVGPWCKGGRPRRRGHARRGLIDTFRCTRRPANRRSRRPPLRCRSDPASKATICRLGPRLNELPCRHLPGSAVGVAAGAVSKPPLLDDPARAENDVGMSVSEFIEPCLPSRTGRPQSGAG